MVRPADGTRIDSADVYKRNELAGTMTRSSGDVEFAYSQLYLEGNGPPVASSLPRRAAPYRTILKWLFGNERGLTARTSPLNLDPPFCV